MRCVLHVTEQEYARILQLNHDRLVLNNRDEKLLHGLESLFGHDVAHAVRGLEECRVEKHDSLGGMRRLDPCA